MVAADDTDCRQTVVCGKNIPYVCRASYLPYSVLTGGEPVNQSWQVVPKCHRGRCTFAEKIAAWVNLIAFAVTAVLTLRSLVFIWMIAVTGKIPKTQTCLRTDQVFG